jgi:hypothetical protein
VQARQRLEDMNAYEYFARRHMGPLCPACRRSAAVVDLFSVGAASHVRLRCARGHWYTVDRADLPGLRGMTF